MTDLQCIKIDSINDVSVVKLKDEKVMAPAQVETLGAELLSLVGTNPNEDGSNTGTNVLINFENVRFFSSGAINKLIVLEKRVRAGGGQIRLSNMQPEVRDLFSYTNLDQMFDNRDVVNGVDFNALEVSHDIACSPGNPK